MGLFDKLKRASDNFFDGLKENAVEKALSDARENRIKKEADDKLANKKNEIDYAEELRRKWDSKYYFEVLSNFDKENFLKTGKLLDEELEELEKIRLEKKQQKEIEEKEKIERNERIKIIEKENREKIKSGFIKKYGEEIGKKIAKKELFVGMNLEMLKDVKGKHSEKVENVTNGKTKVKLYYEKSKNRLGNISYGFEVSLENGLVVGWKDRKNRGTKEI